MSPVGSGTARAAGKRRRRRIVILTHETNDPTEPVTMRPPMAPTLRINSSVRRTERPRATVTACALPPSPRLVRTVTVRDPVAREPPPILSPAVQYRRRPQKGRRSHWTEGNPALLLDPQAPRLT